MSNKKGYIFINYRREDSRWNTLALYNKLKQYFSEDQLFKDFNAIKPGDDFVESIHKALTDCDVLLVMIGKNWSQMKGVDGRRRLDEPQDFVKREIVTALERKIKVIPVLFDDAQMPLEEEMPPEMAALSRRQCMKIDNTRFDDDVRNLAEAINDIINPGQPLKKIDADNEKAPQQPPPAEKPPVRRPDSLTSSNPLSRPPKPDNYLLFAILTTIICCFPFGIAGIVAANKVDSLFAQGKYAEAASKSAAAKRWSIIAFVVGIFFYIVLAVLYDIGNEMEQQGYQQP